MEWNEKNLSVGPSREVRVPPSEILDIVGRQKFVVDKKIDAGDFHYAFVIKK